MNYTYTNFMSSSAYDKETMCPTQESYKSFQITWNNFEKYTREMADKIDVESNLTKVVEMELEYLTKLNEFYSVIANDKLNAWDLITAKYIPTLAMVIGIICTALASSPLQVNGDTKAKQILSSTGMMGTGAGLISKVKKSKVNNFQKNALEAINSMCIAVKQNIRIHQKLLSVGVRTREDAVKCNIKVLQDGSIEIYRKYD